ECNLEALEAAADAVESGDRQKLVSFLSKWLMMLCTHDLDDEVADRINNQIRRMSDEEITVWFAEGHEVAVIKTESSRLSLKPTSISNPLATMIAIEREIDVAMRERRRSTIH